MKLEQALKDPCIIINGSFENKEAVLDEVANRVCAFLHIEGACMTSVREALAEREAMGSTGIGKGIAIAHCHIDAIEEFIVGAITIPQGVDFQSLDGKPVKLVFFVVGPDAKKSEHVHLIALIAQVCRKEGQIEQLLQQRDIESFRRTLTGLRAESGEVSQKNIASLKDMLHVFVQSDEDSFYQILEMIVAVAPTSTVVVDTEETGRYLTQTPLFAGFFSMEESDNSRTIVAIIDRQLTNDIIERIETVTGPLDECKNTLVTVSQLYFSAGSLEV